VGQVARPPWFLIRGRNMCGYKLGGSSDLVDGVAGKYSYCPGMKLKLLSQRYCFLRPCLCDFVVSFLSKLFFSPHASVADSMAFSWISQFAFKII
jgi:hypothetical protein